MHHHLSRFVKKECIRRKIPAPLSLIVCSLGHLIHTHMPTYLPLHYELRSSNSISTLPMDACLALVTLLLVKQNVHLLPINGVR